MLAHKYRANMTEDQREHYREKNKEYKIINRARSAEWLKKPENREKKLLYLKDYSRKHPRTKKEKKYRKEFCELCNIDIPEILDVHHIIPLSIGGVNREDNRITVCANCHRMIHAGLIELLSKKGQTIGEML